MSTWRLKLLYDGGCPFCRREVDFLRRRNHRMLLRFEDISDPRFDPAKYGLTKEEVHRVLHGVLPDGSVVRGMDAIRRAYQAVGLGWITAPTALPGIRWLADRVYETFARNRLRLGRVFGRCEEGTCSVRPMPEATSPAGSESS